MTKDDFVALLKRWMPRTYWGDFEGHSGWEIFQAMAKLGERLSEAVSRMASALHPSLASGGQRAILEFSAYSLNPLSLKAGSIIERDDGVRYRTTHDAIISTAGATIEAESLAMSYQANHREGATYKIAIPAEGSTVDAGWPATYKSTVQEGRPATLDLLAWQRGFRRRHGEDDETLRERIRSVGEPVVTKPAIERCLQISGLSGQITEGFELANCYQRNYFRIDIGDYSTDQMAFVDYAYADQSYVEGWQEPETESKIYALMACVERRKAAGIYWHIKDSIGLWRPVPQHGLLEMNREWEDDECE